MTLITKHFYHVRWEHFPTLQESTSVQSVLQVSCTFLTFWLIGTYRLASEITKTFYDISATLIAGFCLKKRLNRFNQIITAGVYEKNIPGTVNTTLQEAGNPFCFFFLESLDLRPPNNKSSTLPLK